jgi:hypothetical protein
MRSNPSSYLGRSLAVKTGVQASTRRWSDNVAEAALLLSLCGATRLVLSGFAKRLTPFRYGV